MNVNQESIQEGPCRGSLLTIGNRYRFEVEFTPSAFPWETQGGSFLGRDEGGMLHFENGSSRTGFYDDNLLAIVGCV